MATWEEYGIDPKKVWANPYDKKKIKDTKSKKDKKAFKLIAPDWR